MKLLKFRSSHHRVRAFTFWDLLVVMAALVLVPLSLPMFPWPHRRVSGATIHCVNNLKQVGMAFRMWSNDNGEKFPFLVSTNSGGSMEYAGTGEVFHHYLAISNEVNSPKVLTCSTDTARRRTSDFAGLSDRNLSYFVGLDATETNPRTILSGDRNLSTNGRIVSGILTVTNSSTIGWTKDIHNRAGNIGLADGSVQQVRDSIGLRREFDSGTNLPARLAIP